MNLPNQLTMSRLVLTGFFVACFYTSWDNAYSIALLIFSVASITDYLDGSIARARGLVTNFGKLFDPLADQILIAAAFILLSWDHMIPAWVTIAILAREFFVTGIRLVAAGRGAVLAAEKLGKHKMMWQIITVLYFMLRAASQEPMFGFFRSAFAPSTTHDWIASFIIGFTTLLTLVSGFSYFWKNRHLFDDA
ncbi:MAG: CDP-diacylglycerol--glycerol-3-phosphate 3-phosphatidyltransferase [Prosthecobacter sp.]|nr:CDP-diacylglycerol--glycerol-3-phosphate 3-phosphatidyltransferase [Prosthecobacter sp.]